ncbi:MAG: peptidylprolyl isomerase [Haliscomenobacter sp.]|nr:peptidylprolyl isomerase [Haliscomenobacter sp.]MBK9488150.1 peptidylprolyl isomerase [Haliscomenobacter sp.]
MRYLIFAVLLTTTMAATAQRQILDKMVATVGGEITLLAEVEEQYAYTKAQRNGAIPPEARCMLVEQILVNKLLLNQAKLDSIEVKDEEVESQLTARIERILSYMNDDLKQFEEYYGQTVNEVREQFREDLRNNLLIERMRAKIMADVSVTPSEVKDFFRRIPKDSLPYFSSEVEVGEIVYKVPINKEQKRVTMEKLEDIRKRIVEGKEDFAELAKKYSDDGSARGGGDLGWAKRGKYVTEFEAAAYKLEEMEVSPVIETQFGFHVLQMLGRRGNSIHVRHILIRPEITDEDVDLGQRHMDTVRTLLIKDSISFSRAVKKYSDKNVQSFNNDGRMVNPTSGNTFFEVGDLDPDIYFAIDTMKMNGVSKPIEFRDESGDYFFRLVKLMSRTVPHKANLAQDYAKIQKAAIESKRNEIVNKWVEERIQKTFMLIDRQYEGCPNLAPWMKENMAAAKPD